MLPDDFDPDALNPVPLVVVAPMGGRRRAGRRWPEGETIVPAGEMTAAEAELIGSDPAMVVRAAPDAAEPAPSIEAAGRKGAQSAGDDQGHNDKSFLEQVKATIGELLPEEYGKDGKPGVDAIRKRLPEDVRADLNADIRDVAWTEILAAKAQTGGASESAQT